MANQRRLWSDPAVRDARQAAAEAVLGQSMDPAPLGSVVTHNGGAAEIPRRVVKKPIKFPRDRR